MTPLVDVKELTVMCTHLPHCPSFNATDAVAAHVVAAHPEQGWSLLCNGVLLFDDDGELRPDGQVVEPHALVALH